MLRRPKKHELLTELIRTLIADQQMQPGTRLPGEITLAKMFATSRPAARTALIALELAGEVDVRSGRGAYVRDPSLPLVIDLPEGVGPLEMLHARVTIECVLVVEACRNAAPATLCALQKSMVEDEHWSADAPGSHDAGFHLAIARCAGNQVLESVLRVILEQQPRSSGQLDGSMAICEAVDHLAIFEAIASGQSQHAQTLMRAHLRRHEEMMRGFHRERIPWSDKPEKSRRALHPFDRIVRQIGYERRSNGG